MWALYVKEIRSFLSSLIGYVVVGVFLALAGIYLWVFPDPQFNIFVGGKASLESFFALAPYLFLLLIPAITMRSFAEEKRTGTIELLMTKPITDYQIVFAKYLAGLTLVVIALLPTLTYYWCISELKTDLSAVHTGKMWGSYMGLLFLGSCYVAIGLFASSLSSNQVVSFVLGCVMCLFMFKGFDGISILFGAKDSLIMKLGIADHHHFIQKGLVDTRDLVYFISVMVLFVLLTKMVVTARTWNHGASGLMPRIKANLDVAISVVLIVLINFISAYKFERFDLTLDKRYSLKEATKKFLSDEDLFSSDVYVKVYFTGDLPPDWLNFRNEIKLKLEEYSSYAGDKLQVEWISVFDDEATQESDLNELRSMGLSDIWASDFSDNKANHARTIPGIVLNYPGSEPAAVPLIPIRQYKSMHPSQLTRENILRLLDRALIEFEHHMTSGLRKVITQDRHTVAFLEGHGELDKSRTKSATNILSEYYNVDRIDILEVTETTQEGQAEEILHSLDNIDLLMINKPEQPITKMEKFVIDQFIMNGGKVIWALDMVNDHRDSLYSQSAGFHTYGIPYENSLNLLEQLHRYGVRIEPVFIMEHPSRCAPCELPWKRSSAANAEIFFPVRPWDFYPLVYDWSNPIIRNGKEIKSQQHRITSGILPVKLEYASYISPLERENKDVRGTVLLETSDSSTYRRAPIDIFSNIVMQPKQYNKKYMPVAVLLEGQFTSIWKNRLKPGKLEAMTNVKILEQSRPTSMIVISDGDIFKNDILYPNGSVMNVGNDSLRETAGKVVDISQSPYFEKGPNYGNREFLLNSVEYLLGEEVMMATRIKYIPEYLDKNLIEKSKTKWQFINVGLPILILLFLGGGQALIRRRKYVR